MAKLVSGEDYALFIKAWNDVREERINGDFMGSTHEEVARRVGIATTLVPARLAGLKKLGVHPKPMPKGRVKQTLTQGEIDRLNALCGG